MRALVAGHIPGALLYVRQGNRSYTVAAGYADKAKKVPMRANDTYYIGSTSKSFAAVLVMRLVAQGKIALDAPVSRYLPGVLPGGDRITIRDLLSHKSGLYEWNQDPKVLAPILAHNWRVHWTPKEAVAISAAHPLPFCPRHEVQLHGHGLLRARPVVQRVGGKPYEQQLRDYTLRPLKLNHTTLPTRTGTLPDVHGYLALNVYDQKASPVPIDTAALPPSLGWAAGGMRSTLADIADFYRGLFSGKLIPQAQVAAMEDTQATGGQYGLGLMPTGPHAYQWVINTTCGRAWGHGGHWAGQWHLPISSPDGSRQAVLLVNADPTLIPPAQMTRIYTLLATAYCRGLPS